MTIDEMTFDNVKSLALRYPNAPRGLTRTRVKDGAFIAYAAGAEEVRRFVRIAKNDLRERELRKASYAGDHGHCTIGGRRFTLYRTRPAALIRDDFAEWIGANWQKVLTVDGRERQSTKPLRTADVQCLPVGRFAFEVRQRAKELNEPTGLIHDDAWNTAYDMERRVAQYHAEMERDRKAGESFVVTRLQAVLLAGMVQHRRRNYAEAVDCFISVAACAVKAAEYEARMHGKSAPRPDGGAPDTEPTGGGETLQNG